MKIGLFYKENKIEKSLLNILLDKIQKAGFDIDNENPDVVIYVGGDGTFLRAVHHYLPILEKIKIVGLNKGHLGFFSSFELDEIDSLLMGLKDNSLVSNSYPLLKAEIGDSEIYAINEIRIESPFQTLISEVEINHQKLETFRGNGLVVSSPLGSSAYNKSLGGAIVSPNLEAFELTEIAPINNRVYSSLHSSLVLDKSSEIVLTPKTSNILVGYDQLIKDDLDTKLIKLSLSNKRVSLLYKDGYDYISHLSRTFIGDKK